MKTSMEINQAELRTAVESAVDRMNNHSMPGWGVAIELNEDGSIFESDIISRDITFRESQNLAFVESWTDEYQNSVRAWFADNCDQKEAAEKFFEENDIDEDTFNFTELVKIGFPDELQRSYEEYQELVISEASVRMVEYILENIETIAM